MGLLLSVVISYAGVLEAMDCLKHILAGMLPEGDPDFRALVELYTRQLSLANGPAAANGWAHESGQGYLCLTEDDEGHLKSAAVKYYDGSKPDSASILFSTKINSFGQQSTESNSSQANGDYNKRSDPHSTTTTKTLYANTSESFSVGQRNRSITPSYENVSDPTPFSGDSFERNLSEQRTSVERPVTKPGHHHAWQEDLSEKQQSSNEEQQEESHKDEQADENQSRSDVSEGKGKLKWHYRPLSPTPPTLPEIHFQSFDDKNKDSPYSEDFLRSLDGIKYRPLQRSDPSGRRRSYKKRHSSSSTSSRESRASREEELKMFTSLEEAEFERAGTDDATSFGSSPNLAARSVSRSRSRDNSNERRNESRSGATSPVVAGSIEEEQAEPKPRLRDLPRLGSFEEHAEPAATADEVTQPAEEEDDFWGHSGD